MGGGTSQDQNARSTLFLEQFICFDLRQAKPAMKTQKKVKIPSTRAHPFSVALP
jgi:hypothetical protein